MPDKGTPPHRRSESYGDILRSTALIGASSVAAMALSLLRMKALAVLLGPAGIGLVALYSSVAELAAAIAGMGISQSGVRQIAQAETTGDGARIAGTLLVLRRVSLLLGIGGAIGLAILALPASLLTFGSAEHALAVAALGLLVLFRTLAGGHTALLQGTRRVGELAQLNIVAAGAAVAITVPLVLVWREAAIVPALIGVAFVTWLAARAYARRRPLVRAASVPGSQLRAEAGELLRLGFAFMVSGFLAMGAAYAIRILVLHEAGVAAAGLYQAAWTVAGLYVGIVLQAMGTDFYPRLTGVASDDAEIRRLVGEQTEVSLLLAGPGVLATITFAHLAMVGFYSEDFAAAAGLLRWLCLGMMLRVIAWPMGFIIVAKGWQKTFIAVEIGAAALHVGAAALLLPVFGPDGAGMAFACLYACHGLAVYLVARWRCGFRLARGNRGLLLIFAAATLAAFLGFHLLHFWPATWLGLALTCASGLFSLHALARLVPAGGLPARLLALPYLRRLGSGARPT